MDKQPNRCMRKQDDDKDDQKLAAKPKKEVPTDDEDSQDNEEQDNEENNEQEMIKKASIKEMSVGSTQVPFLMCTLEKPQKYCSTSSLLFTFCYFYF